MKKLVNVKGGEIYAIPLFVSDVPDVRSFAKDSFTERKREFAFCRVIEDMLGAGILIEVFDLIGELSQDIESIITSDLLFNPVAVSGLGIYKKRWKKVHTHDGYDKEKDSGYSKIKLVLGAKGNFRLWQNGIEKPISDVEAQEYEMWTLWRASHLEKRIIKELFVNE